MSLQLFEELKRRTKKRDFSLKSLLFEEQYNFVVDPSPFKTAVCSRRAGKTVGCAADMVDTCLKSQGVTVLYITLSRSNAKKIIWPELKRLNSDYVLEGVVNESELSIRYPNNSVLYCSGASDKSEIEKFRGLALKKVYIDECQSFPSWIEELIDDVLAPALMDHAGTICLIGTPGPVPAGFFHDTSHSNTWTHHAWTFWQNPHIPIKSGVSHTAIFDREIKRRGIDPGHPSIQREWFGKWALDSDALVYCYDSNKNHYEGVTLHKPVYILGVDFGYEDADALALLAWDEGSPITYLVQEVVIPKQGITPLISQIESLRLRYDISKIVADFGGLGKKIAEEMIKRWQIPMAPAEKSRKVENIEIMNDAMRRGHFMAKKQSRFAHDSMILEWDKDKSTPERRVISDRFHSDILDAALYAFRESPAYSWVPPKEQSKYGTPEWAKEQEDAMERAAEEYFASLSQNDSSSY